MATVRINPGTTEYTVPAKLAGFDSMTITADLADFLDTKSTIVFEAFAVDEKGRNLSIARAVSIGGVRETLHHITRQPLANPNLLTITTEANLQHKGDVTVRLTVEGAAARISIPQIVTV